MEQQEISEKIQELQQLEQTLQTLTNQKHHSQLQLAEIDNALKELSTVTQDPYKIIGNLMIQTNKKDLEQDLKERQEVLQLRIKTLDKQEKQQQEKAGALQKEVMKHLT